MTGQILKPDAGRVENSSASLPSSRKCVSSQRTILSCLFRLQVICQPSRFLLHPQENNLFLSSPPFTVPLLVSRNKARNNPADNGKCNRSICMIFFFLKSTIHLNLESIWIEWWWSGFWVSPGKKMSHFFISQMSHFFISQNLWSPQKGIQLCYGKVILIKQWYEVLEVIGIDWFGLSDCLLYISLICYK